MIAVISCVVVLVLSPFTLSGEAPALNPFAFPADLIVGSKAQTVCSAYLGAQPLHFRWLKDGKPLSLGRVQQINEALSQLILEQLQLKHIGNYTCIVSNSFGSRESTASLFIKAPPMWVKEPKDMKIPIKGSVLIECEASGSPPVTIMWQRRSSVMGDLIPVETSRAIQILHNNSLAINNAQKTEDGLYVCEASNGIGKILRKSLHVTVYEKPEVQQMSEHVTVEKGSTAFLSCFATGDNPLSLIWKKNRKSLNDWPETSNRFTFSETAGADSTKFIVTITAVEMSDEGIYTCEAVNEFGSDYADIRLLLVERPQIPEGIEVVDIWSRSARIRWSVPSNGNSPIINYIVEYWSNLGVHHNETIASTTTSCILRDLTPFTLYKINVWAVNSIGTSDPSALVQFTTSKEEPSAPPTDLNVEDTGSTFVRLHWKPPPQQHWHGGISGYYVGYKLSSSKNEYTFNTVEPSEGGVYYVLRGLRKGSRYSVVVRAVNEMGSGPLSQEIHFRTLNHEPPPRPTLMVRSIGSTYLQVQWFVDSESRSSVIGFVLHFRKQFSPWEEILIPDPLQNSFTLTNLDSGVSYQIFITSRDSKTMSEPSDTASVQTMHETIIHQEASVPANAALDEFTQTLYIVIPISVATVIIVTVIVIACVYVYSKKPLPVPSMYGDLTPDKNFSYMATVPRNRDPIPHLAFDGMKQGSPYSTVPLTRSEIDEEEPIYESVMEEIRAQIKQRNFRENQNLGNATVV